MSETEDKNVAEKGKKVILRYLMLVFLCGGQEATNKYFKFKTTCSTAQKLMYSSETVYVGSSVGSRRDE